ncbi:MAG: DNA internalization-related competence protein ComEC/Rec2, partial [Pseudomonadota bacterium]
MSYGRSPSILCLSCAWSGGILIEGFVGGSALFWTVSAAISVVLVTLMVVMPLVSCRLDLFALWQDFARGKGQGEDLFGSGLAGLGSSADTPQPQARGPVEPMARGSIGMRWARVGLASSSVLIAVLAIAGGGFASALVRECSRKNPVLSSPTESQIYEGEIVRPVEELKGFRRALVDVDGIVVQEVTRVGAGAGVGAGVEALRGYRARVLVAASTENDHEPRRLLPGDRVRFRAALRPPRSYQNEGAFDRQRFLAGQGIDGVATASLPGIVKTSAPPHWSIWRLAALIQATASKAIIQSASGRGADLLRALVLGERGTVDEGVEDAFRRAGVTHVLSVSGLHLAAVAMLFFSVFRRVWLWVPRVAERIPAERVAACIAIASSIVYALVTGAEVATVRALICAVIVLGARILGRRPSGAATLAAASFAILAVSPWAVYEASFQLTIVASAALVWVAVSVPSPPSKTAWRRVLGWMLRLTVASAAATAATAPLTVFHFGTFQPAGIITNLLIVPFAEGVILPFGLASVALASLLPSMLSSALVAVAASLTGALIRVVEWLSAWCPSIEVPPLHSWELTVLAVALVVAAAVWPAKRAIPILASGLAVVALSYLLPHWRVLGPDRLRATFLDVGQGDAAVIELPCGQTWLVDAGGTTVSSGGPGEQAVWRFLRARRISKLDLVIVTHPHPDHYGGVAAVARHLPISEVWVTSLSPTEHGDAPTDAAQKASNAGAADDQSWEFLAGELAKRHIPIRQIAAGAARECGNTRLLALAPPDSTNQMSEPVGDPTAFGHSSMLDHLSSSAPESFGLNDSSLVFRVEHGGRAILLAGDIEAKGEARLLASVPPFLAKADVVKVPHHGSSTSSTLGFVT